MSKNVKTPEAIVSYPNLDKPQASKNGKPKYSATFIFTPEVLATPAGKAAIAAMKEAAYEAAETFFGLTYKVNEKKTITTREAMDQGKIKSPFRTDAEDKGYPEGSTFINCRSVNKPGCVYSWPSKEDPKKPMKIEDADLKDVVYPGAVAVGLVSAFGYDTDGNKGVSFGLNGLQKLRDGERIDGRVDAQDAFDVDLTATPTPIEDLI